MNGASGRKVPDKVLECETAFWQVAEILPCQPWPLVCHDAHHSLLTDMPSTSTIPSAAALGIGERRGNRGIKLTTANSSFAGPSAAVHVGVVSILRSDM